MLLNPLILISLAIFGLSFFALVIITRIKEMRAAGIKLFSGQTLLSIMGHSLSTDIKWLLLSALLSFLGGDFNFTNASLSNEFELQSISSCY